MADDEIAPFAQARHQPLQYLYLGLPVEIDHHVADQDDVEQPDVGQFLIQIDVMKHLSAYMVTLTINLEPVYGIIMAFLFFGESEKMTAGFYIGTLIILLTVLSFPMMNKYYSKLQRVRANRID